MGGVSGFRSCWAAGAKSLWPPDSGPKDVCVIWRTVSGEQRLQSTASSGKPGLQHGSNETLPPKGIQRHYLPMQWLLLANTKRGTPTATATFIALNVMSIEFAHCCQDASGKGWSAAKCTTASASRNVSTHAVSRCIMLPTTSSVPCG